MKPLTPEQVDWIALSLVNTGEVTKHHQTYFKSGHPPGCSPSCCSTR